MPRLVLAFVLALLAGCVTPGAPEDAPTDAPAPDEGPPALVLADLTSASCAYNDVIFLVPHAQAQALLPEGFRPRPFPNEAASAIVTNVIACEEGFAWNAADTFVVVEPIVPPAWMEAFDAANRTPRAEERPSDTLYLDIYMLAGFTQHEGLAALFERGGMPVAPAQVAKTSLPAPVGSLSQGSVTDADGPLLTYSVAGRPLGGLFAHHRQWRETPEGLLLLERDMSSRGEPLDLTQGSAQCAVRPGSLLAEITGGVPCALGQDITNEFTWQGRAYLFPGTSGATFAQADE